MRDRSGEGFGYLLGALPFAAVAMGSQNPWVKLFAALGAGVLTAKAGDCFQATAREAYYQLEKAPEARQLPQG